MPECFNKRTIQMMDPWNKMTGEYMPYIHVPCGKCEQCIRRRRMEWGFRLEVQLRESKTAYFATLTYSTENLKIDKYGNKILDKKDTELFFKKLRINHERNKRIRRDHYIHNLQNKDKIKYYICGEYGEGEGATNRPHYHAIIFNASYEIIEETWDKGHTHVVKANHKTIAYCTKYADKWKDKKQDWRKPKEFNLQSEGIGFGYIDKMRDWHKRNLEVNYVTSQRLIKIPMPRIYRLKMFTENELLYQRSIISNEIERLKAEEIGALGEIAYNDRIFKKRNYIRRKFQKALKKRNDADQLREIHSQSKH